MAENYKTPAYEKIRAALYTGKFYIITQGGMSAGKTYAIMILLIGYAGTFSDRIITCVGQSFPHLKKGAIRDFQNIMKNAEIWEPERWNQSALTYTFANGSILEFVSVDKLGAHGPRRDVLFVNEANAMAYETFDQLASRTRHFCIIDYNPTAEFWAHTELLANHRADCEFLVLTYKDNTALSARERQNIERHAPKKGEPASNWWTVYGLGQIGSLEGNIYSGWRKATDEDYKNARLIRYGLDFGFSNDESGLVAIYQTTKDEIIIKELIYKTGILGSQYGTELKNAGVDPSVVIIADSARPEIIAEIKAQGFQCTGADKNPGSVLRGIDRVKQAAIIYDGKNLEREYLSYAWRQTRTGETLDVPQDGNDHLMDALRYAIDDLQNFHWGF